MVAVDGPSRELAKLVMNFANMYDKMESMKHRHMMELMELESKWLDFTRDLEVHGMQTFMEAQVGIENENRALFGSGSATVNVEFVCWISSQTVGRSDSTIGKLPTSRSLMRSEMDIRTCIIDYSDMGKMVVNKGSENGDGALQVRPWSHLLPEIFELIVRHLTIVDHLHIGRVCKEWDLAIRAIPPHNGLPCMVSISRDGKTCTLVDPFCNETNIMCESLPSRCNILYSKDGWLLVLHTSDMDSDIHSVFFFNPLSQIRIDVPNITFPCCIRAFAFSEPPTSPDCMVIALRPLCEEDVNIHICRRGDKEWTDLGERENILPFVMSHVSPVFYNGLFYCLGDDGRVGVFNFRENVWIVMANPTPQPPVSAKAKELYIAESDGDLIMVFVSKFGDVVRVYELDFLKNKWNVINTFRERTLFVGRLSSICKKADALTSNSIYFPRTKDGAFMFYSCEESKFSQGGNFYGSRVFRLGFWIQPVWFKPLPEKQIQWSK